MAEDLETNLSTYTAQLQQVEAALTNEPNNEELQKLQTDLNEVIQLTKDLIEAQPGRKGDVIDKNSATYTCKWKIDDQCRAPYGGDGLYYPATIQNIMDDSTVTVVFDNYGNTEDVQISLLKEVKEILEETKVASATADARSKSKKEAVAAEREYKRKKAAKKAQRIKDLEEKREEEKHKWQNFSHKATSKSKKGFVKKSIFASPESNLGRVGVGTCGSGGKPMTPFSKINAERTHQQRKK